MRRLPALVICAVLLARASVISAAWTVDAGGACVRQWAPSDLLRGPVAIVNGPILPARTMVGGAEYAWNKPEWRWWYTFVLGLGVTGVSGAAGVYQGVWWMGAGVADLLTGGYFEIAPQQATERSVEPVVSEVIAGRPPAPTEDPCGRPLAAAQ